MESSEGKGLAIIVFPPVSAFYHRPVAIHDVLTHSVAVPRPGNRRLTHAGGRQTLKGAIKAKRSYPMKRNADDSVSGCIPLATGLEQEPGAPFGFIDPDFDQASRGDITVFSADVVGLAQASGKGLVVLAQFGEHVQGFDVVGIIVYYALAAGDKWKFLVFR
jgi:hypothetical protein